MFWNSTFCRLSYSFFRKLCNNYRYWYGEWNETTIPILAVDPVGFVLKYQNIQLNLWTHNRQKYAACAHDNPIQHFYHKNQEK